ncbi:hypothetical protein VTK73DRAFT_4255 [Phialemonium thermophilum]|uniref:Uncharacterized protein n=1 Tax=Phialemonium thermophilum TaxID=223376 RepID=A0ABR3VBG8_9PEZI
MQPSACCRPVAEQSPLPKTAARLRRGAERTGLLRRRLRRCGRDRHQGPAQVTVGSIYCSLTRGYSPHGREQYEIPTPVDMFQHRTFPLLGDTTEDRIVAKCWAGGYGSVAELELVFRNMGDGAEWYAFEAEDDGFFEEQQARCVEWERDGQLDALLARHVI